LIAPGFLVTAAAGLLTCWADRKISARLQWRQGPPWYQPLADILKLLGKEVILPEGAAKTVFLGAPLVGLAAVTLVSTMLWLPPLGFIGDLIVVLYLLTIPSTALIIGGSASRNPLAAIGASREMKLILAYELPFLLVVLTVADKAGSLLLGQIVAYQTANGLLLFKPSGLLAGLAALLVVQAKLALAPFDIPEAEQELMGGPLLEYSGAPLAVFKLTRAMLFYILPVFLIILFLGGVDLSSLAGAGWFLVKYLVIVILITLIKNTNPRLRIDHAVRLFWGPVTIMAAAGFVLALLGF
jgi:NADH-quinone oxidoreductase subunit H